VSSEVGGKKGLRARTGEVKRRTETVLVCTDGEAVGEIRYLEQQLQQALRGDAERDEADRRAPAVAQQIRLLEQRARDATVEIKVAHIGKRWQTLLDAHPPTKAQKAKHGARLDHNPDTFPYAAVAACIVEVDGEAVDESDESVRDFFDPLPDGEFASTWLTVQAVNVGTNTVPFSSRASMLLRDSEPSSTSAEPTGSPEATS
jgi:hypothetical protein